MALRRYALFGALSCALLCSVTPRSTGQPAPERAGVTSPSDWIPTRRPVSFLDTLAETMANRRVMAVDIAASPYAMEDPAAAMAREEKTVGKLQALSKAFSSEGENLIPYALRKTWVIAPETREEVSTDLGKMTVLDAASRGLLLVHLLGQITPEEAAALGSEEGLAVTDLTEGLQGVAARALRPPLVVEDSTNPRLDGSRVYGYNPFRVIKGRINKPLDMKKVRLKARLAIADISIRGDNSETQLGVGRESVPFLRELVPQPMESRSSLDLPVLTEVANTLKPTDLQGKTLTQPVGIQGIKTVEQVVAQVAKVTGLRLHAGSLYGSLRMYLGSSSIECGEVLDGLSLALTASWRRVGNDYVLAWDKRGLGALQLKVAEQARAIVNPVNERNRDTWADEGWKALSAALPFDPEDPLRPTPEQRKRLSQRPTEEAPGTGKITWDEMTTGQRDAVKEIILSEELGPSAFSAEDPSSPGRRLNEGDLPRVSILGSVRVILSVSIPGSGWVNVPGAWGDGTSQRFQFTLWPRERDEPTEEEDLEQALSPQAVVLPAEVRGLISPPLTPARLATLAEEMKRHGVNALYYPVLYGGYATFPSRSFPLHPSLDGENGWKAAVEAMAPHGIKVIGTLNVLSWQTPGSRTHWLSKYPGWMEADALGRTRLQWLDQHPNPPRPPLFSEIGPNAIMLTAPPIGTAANFVRVTEPQVERKLEILVDEFAGQSGSSGIAFLDWIYSASQGMSRPTPPPLGCAMPDRLASIRKSGDDPIDEPVANLTFRPRLEDRLRSAHEWDDPEETPAEPFVEDAHLGLVSRLAKRARAARKDWKTWLLDNSGWLPYLRDDSPKAKPLPFDFCLDGLGSYMQDGYTGWILPMWPRNASIAPEPEANEKGRPAMVTYVHSWEALDLSGPKVKAILLDMREAPDDTTDTLALLKAPPTPARAATPPAKHP